MAVISSSAPETAGRTIRPAGRRVLAALLGLLLLGVAALLAACEGEPTPAIGPVGPSTPVPTATAVPTGTPVAISGPGADIYAAGHAAMVQLTSYHFTTDSDLGRGVTQHIEGDWAAPNKVRMTVTTKGGGQDGTQQIVRIGTAEWTRRTDADAWAAMQNPPPAETAPDQIAGLLRYGLLESSEETTLNNQAVYHLTFTLDPARLVTASPSTGISKGNGELWIAKDTHYIVQIKLVFTSTVTAARGAATSVMKLAQFNSPVDIPQPAP